MAQRASAQSEQQRAHKDVVCKQLDNIQGQVQRLTTDIDGLKHSVAAHDGRLKNAKDEAYLLNQKFGELADTVKSSPNNRPDTAALWAHEIDTDTHAYEAIAGNIFVMPKQGAAPVSPSSLSQTLNTDKTNAAKHRAPNNLIITLERTFVTQLRSRRVKSIGTPVVNTIQSTPSLRGLKVHNTGSNLILSFHDRKPALDIKNKDAPAFLYPVQKHIVF